MKRLLLFLLFGVLTNNLLAQEICDNGIDDDGDGFVDLNDPDCNCFGIEIDSIRSLFPNPSFEDTVCCPAGLTRMHCASSWIQASIATSDYFNTCGTTSISHIFFPPPFPLPGGGSGYVGFYNFNDSVFRAPPTYLYQEYVGACLDTPVIVGEEYQMQFFLSGALRTVDSAISDSTLVVSIFGTPDCGDLPWASEVCPLGSGSWIELGRDTVRLDSNNWKQVNIQFTAPVDIRAVAIGGACNSGSAVFSNVSYGPYFYMDQLLLAETSVFKRVVIAESGKWCTNDLQLTANVDVQGGTWQWYRAGIALPGETGPSLDLMIYGTDHVFSAVYTLNGDCISVDYTVDTTDLANQPIALLLVNQDTIVCSGTVIPVMAAATPSGYNYEWSPPTGVSDPYSLTPEITAASDTSIFYSLTASYPGCPDTSVGFQVDSWSVKVDFGEDTLVCRGDFVPLQASVQPHRSDYQYDWSPTTGLQPTHAPNTYFVADNSITYSLTVSTPVGCTGMDSIYIEVQPDSFASVISDTGFCPPSGGVPLWATGGEEYVWVPDYGLDDVNSDTPWANPATPTRYTVFATNEAGCVDSQEVFVDVYSNAVVYMPDTAIIYPGERYLLDVQSNAHYFEWFPPSGISNTQVSNPEFFPDVRTRYFVTATTEHGCKVKDSIDILVLETVLDMPNAFKPGSNENGIFKVEIRGIAKLNGFTVFNRWGNKVFETTDIREGWDGTFNSVPQPLGVYVYRIDAITDSGARIKKQGNVTLIR